jgi:hypothetical protein
LQATLQSSVEGEFAMDVVSETKGGEYRPVTVALPEA